MVERQLKVWDKVKTIREVTFVNGEIFPKGSLLTFKCKDDELNANFLEDENGVTTVLKDGDFELLKEENQMNKIKMVICENRAVECGEYKVEWYWDYSYLNECDKSKFAVRDKSGVIISLGFTNYNYKQQMEIANLILEKLGLNIELVEEDNSEVLEQISKLEAELEKLRGRIKWNMQSH